MKTAKRNVNGRSKNGGHSTKRVPVALKKLRGSASTTLIKRSFDPANVPDITSEPPPHLDDVGQTEWRHSVSFAPPGMLKETDRGILEAWCKNYSRYRKACAIDDITTQMNCELLLLKMSDKLGFNPTARPRVVAWTSNPGP